MKAGSMSVLVVLLMGCVSPACAGTVQYLLTATLGPVQYYSPAQEARFSDLLGPLSGGTMEIRYCMDEHAFDWLEGIDPRSLLGQHTEVVAQHTQVSFYDTGGVMHLDFEARGSFIFRPYGGTMRAAQTDYPQDGQYFFFYANIPTAKPGEFHHPLYLSSVFFFDWLYASFDGKNAAFFTLDGPATMTMEPGCIIPIPEAALAGYALLLSLAWRRYGITQSR
ncbi:MAG: hypothetical protein IT445_21170 [Phycisphaeraceae bacterium]|nr:hypothetical protein [Phycisphaeraceae bacterium]